jgi:HEAT repeat protein
VLPDLLDRLAHEDDAGLQMAFASALGKMGATKAIDPLLALLRGAKTQDARTEFVLALARLVGQEHHYIRLQSRVESDPGTVLSQAATSLKSKLVKAQWSSVEIETGLDSAAEALAHDDLPHGVTMLHDALQYLPAEHLVGSCGVVVQECIRQMAESGSQRLEYVTLALHAFDCELDG